MNTAMIRESCSLVLKQASDAASGHVTGLFYMPSMIVTLCKTIGMLCDEIDGSSNQRKQEKENVESNEFKTSVKDIKRLCAELQGNESKSVFKLFSHHAAEGELYYVAQVVCGSLEFEAKSDTPDNVVDILLSKVRHRCNLVAEAIGWTPPKEEKCPVCSTKQLRSRADHAEHKAIVAQETPDVTDLFYMPGEIVELCEIIRNLCGKVEQLEEELQADFPTAGQTEK
jgi:hypothetical protein